MNSGRHFSPPTPVFRPLDPFSNFTPRSAERVPSCDAVTPPPFRPRPVRMDPTENKEGTAIKQTPAKKFKEPQGGSLSFPVKAKVAPLRARKMAPIKPVAKPSIPTKIFPVKPEILSLHKKTELVKKAVPAVKKSVSSKEEEIRKCEWDRCEKTFVAKVRGNSVVRRYCSATCRGRASEARTGKRTERTKKSKK